MKRGATRVKDLEKRKELKNELIGWGIAIICIVGMSYLTLHQLEHAF